MTSKVTKTSRDSSLEDSIALTANYRVINGITQLSMGESMNEQDVDVIKKTGEKLLNLLRT